MSSPDRPEWHAFAACAGLADAYFSEHCDHHHLLVELCRRICATCPVLIPCHRQADELKPTIGIWAGLTAAERATTRNQP